MDGEWDGCSVRKKGLADKGTSCERMGGGGGGGCVGDDDDGGDVFDMKEEIEDDMMLRGRSNRFRLPRVSLLGKPLNYKAHRRDMRFRWIQARIYNFLERPKNWTAWIYHFAVFALILICLTLGVLSSIAAFESILFHAIYLEVVMLLGVMIEFALRLWAAGCRSRYQGKAGRLRFLRRPLCIIDLILILASLSALLVGSTQDHFASAVLSGLRFFQILRMVRMDRRGNSWKLLGSVVWAHRQELVTTLYIGVIGLVFSSYFVYLAEKDQPRPGSDSQAHPKFSNFADSIWWGVVTLCTVGYGDVVPATWGGKVIASISAIFGISFFALPAGILGSGFALKVQQQQRQKHLNRRRVPAANLIQCLWRCYAADANSMSTATWKPHLIPCPSPTSDRAFKNNTSFVSRFSTRRRDRSNNSGGGNSTTPTGNNSNSTTPTTTAQSPMTVRHQSRRSAISNSEEEVPNVLDRSHLSLATGITDNKLQLEPFPFKKENSVSSIGKDSEEEGDLSPRLTQLTEQHKKGIRALRKIRYFVSRRKFREALRPYDVKDVIEQYSAGHVDMLGRIKNLQGRLDQILGRQGSKSKDVYESKVCLASRIVKVERQVDDIENKVDLLVDMYKEDRKLLLTYIQQGAAATPTSSGTQRPTVAATPTPPANQPFKPRPILVDKQITSEPGTPTSLSVSGGVGKHPIKPIMHRNLSDLSQRIKKRVTYRSLPFNDPPTRAQSTANFISPNLGQCNANIPNLPNLPNLPNPTTTVSETGPNTPSTASSPLDSDPSSGLAVPSIMTTTTDASTMNNHSLPTSNRSRQNDSICQERLQNLLSPLLPFHNEEIKMKDFPVSNIPYSSKNERESPSNQSCFFSSETDLSSVVDNYKLPSFYDPQAQTATPCVQIPQSQRQQKQQQQSHHKENEKLKYSEDSRNVIIGLSTVSEQRSIESECNLPNSGISSVSPLPLKEPITAAFLKSADTKTPDEGYSENSGDVKYNSSGSNNDEISPKTSDKTVGFQTNTEDTDNGIETLIDLSLPSNDDSVSPGSVPSDIFRDDPTSYTILISGAEEDASKNSSPTHKPGAKYLAHQRITHL